MTAKKIFLICLLSVLAACGSSRKPVPPGVVPEQGAVLSEDEQYGHEVLDSLTDQYPLDRNDARINRVRTIVDRLTKAAHADQNPWHVYVLIGDDFKNAAATRGNFIFVWTGILNTVKSDAELATILAHEIGHLLAGHTAPDPAEETNRIIAGIAGAAAGGVVGHQGLGGPVADLAELIIRASLEALLVNPDQQDKELEADQIGIFMMADASYDPEEAIQFWDRVQSDPDFSGFPLEFMSSHPSSTSRLERLRTFIEEAKIRYQQAKSGKVSPLPPSQRQTPSSIATNQKENPPPIPTEPPPVARKIDLDDKQGNRESETWKVVDPDTVVFEKPDTKSAIKDRLKNGTEVKVAYIEGRWLKLESPVSGFVIGSHLTPLE